MNHLYEISTGKLVSSTTLPITVIPSGMAVKTTSQTGAWNTSTLGFEPIPNSPIITTGAFFDRFTQDELELLIVLSRTNARAAVFLKRLDLKDTVDLTAQSLIDDITSMKNAGVVTAARGQVILNV